MISVIVPTYNEEEHIGRCLQALQTQSLAKEGFEIVVPDSSSKDNTVEIAKEKADTVFVCKKISAGFGRNQGAKRSKGSILAFVDADSVPGKDWLKAVEESLGNGNAVAVTGPFDCLERDSLQERIFFRLWSAESRLTTWLGFPLLPGFNFAVKRKAFEKVGGFRNENLVCEDFDLSLKLRRVGKIKFNKKMFTYTSARRLREMGIVRYALHGLLSLLFRKKYTWKDHRKDW